MISPLIDVEVDNIIRDPRGHYISMEITYEDERIILLNVYAPTKDSFIESISELISTHEGTEMIIGGDFNTCLNPQSDKIGGTRELQSEYNI